jgi:hypothetical protein
MANWFDDSGEASSEFVEGSTGPDKYRIQIIGSDWAAEHLLLI